MESEKNGIDDLIYTAEIGDTGVENECMDTKGKRRGLNWELGIDIYTLLILHMKELANENLLNRLGTLLSTLW